jgi:hypothetical protein
MDIDNTPARNTTGADAVREGFLHPTRRDAIPVAAAGPFSGDAAGIAEQHPETAMTQTHAMSRRHNGTSTLRAAVLAAGIALALGVGVPWLLTDAPPSAEAALVAKLWGAAPVAAPAPATIRTRAPAH